MRRQVKRMVWWSLFLWLAGLHDGRAEFGTDGVVITSIGSRACANSLVLQPDGKLVAAGYGDDRGEFALLRYTSDGRLDAGFGAGGIRVDAFSTHYHGANSLVLQPDGKLVAAGDGDGFVLARYNSNGSLDAGFGVAGVSAASIGIEAHAYSLVLQPDGKLVAAGSSWNGNAWDFALARFNSSGSLDTGFGTNGTVMTSLTSSDELAYSLVLQPDGKLVAAGYSNWKFALARYNSDGSLDAGFGTGGIVTTSIGDSDDRANSLVLQPDGKLVAAGYGWNTAKAKYDFVLARYNSDGSLDATFGSGGKVMTTLGNLWDAIYSLILQPDGKLVAAGSGGAGYYFALVRYNSNGSLDTSFGANGIVTTPNGSCIRSILLQPDGKLAAAGSSHFNLALARYNSDGTLDKPEPTPTVTMTPTITPTSTAVPVWLPVETFKVFNSRINPLAGECCSIRWNQAESGTVSLKIYDISGREMRNLVDNQWFAGREMHEVYWNGRDIAGRAVASGIYIVHIKSGGGFKAYGKVAVTK